MSPRSVWKIVEVIKRGHEEWGGEPQVDEAGLYRHVEEMLDLEREPPELAPADIVERQVEDISSITWEVTFENETAAGSWPQAQIRAAANWAWIIFRDLFGECPPTGDEDGYVELVHRVLQLRRPHVVERLPPLS